MFVSGVERLGASDYLPSIRVVVHGPISRLFFSSVFPQAH